MPSGATATPSVRTNPPSKTVSSFAPGGTMGSAAVAGFANSSTMTRARRMGKAPGSLIGNDGWGTVTQGALTPFATLGYGIEPLRGSKPPLLLLQTVQRLVGPDE